MSQRHQRQLRKLQDIIRGQDQHIGVYGNIVRSMEKAASRLEHLPEHRSFQMWNDPLMVFRIETIMKLADKWIDKHHAELGHV